MTLDIGTTSLSQARLARGLTIEDAERSTRISRRFIVALEEHDYSVFPAPVYARGFLRTYCRYLGIDPEIQLAELPAGWTESTAPTTPIKPVSTRKPMTFNAGWLVAGATLVAIVGLGFFLSRGGGDLSDLEAQRQAQQTQVPAGVTGSAGTTQQSSQPTPTSTSSSGARALAPGLPGILPDFRSVDVDDVTDFLTQQDISYLRVDTVSTSVAEGLVVSQSPSAGASTDDLDQVTLTVSSGATRTTTTRTDCDVLEASNQRTATEQAYFEANCGETEAPAETLADRTNCEEIRGTDYRSPAERTFFLTYCVTQ